MTPFNIPNMQLVLRNVYDYVRAEADGSRKLRVYACATDFCLNLLTLLKMSKSYEIEPGEVAYCITPSPIPPYYECEAEFTTVIRSGDK